MPFWAKLIAQLIPCALIVIGVFAAVEAWDFHKGSAASSATVVSVRLETGTRKGSDGFSETYTTHYPTLRYSDVDGQEYITESSQPASGFTPEIGQIIPVRYYINNPLWVRPVFSWWTIWSGPMIFVGIGSPLFYRVECNFSHYKTRRCKGQR